jgi:uncharacterized integral membrane protein (TIGR00698 family)
MQDAQHPMSAEIPSLPLPGWLASATSLVPGLTVSILAAMAATFAGALTGGPAPLFAILAGLALRPLIEGPDYGPGLVFAGGRLLYVAIALLGTRISLDDIAALGLEPILIVASGVVLGISFSRFLSIRMGLGRSFGWIAGMAVAICGASAALAAESVLPRTARVRRDTLLVVLTVTVFSSIAMVIYPAVARWLGFDGRETGLLLGATIHDLAQVIGAGYGVSVYTGDVAAVTKLLRVTALAPAITVMALVVHRGRVGSGRPRFPAFLIGFVALSIAHTFHLIDPVLASSFTAASGFAFLVAVTVVGIRTPLRRLALGEWRRILIVAVHTVLLACYVTIFLLLTNVGRQ